MSRTKVKQNLIDASFGNILEYFTYTPDGRTITTTQGNITVPDMTSIHSSGYFTSSNTVQDISGAITYIPPTGTKYVEYSYSGCWTYNDASPILHYRIQLGGTDISHSFKTAHINGATTSPENSMYLRAVIEITGSGSDDIANGKVDTWTTGKVLRAGVRHYSASYEGSINATRRFDGSATLTYRPPTATIVAFK